MIFWLFHSLCHYFCFDNLNITGNKFFRIVKLICLNIDHSPILFQSIHSIIQGFAGKDKTSFYLPLKKNILEKQITNFEIVVAKLFI